MKHSALVAAGVAAILAGCAGGVVYQPPHGVAHVVRTKEVPRSRDDVWASMVPALGRQFFVINTMDRGSGLINVSYSGDPEKYVNCGWIASTVKNARGERSYGFPGSRAQQHYEMFSPQMQLFAIDRRMELDGRVNIILEATRSVTLVTVSSRYVLKRDMTIRSADGRSMNAAHSIAFNGGGRASFPDSGDGRGLECQATGTLEGEILDLIR